MSTYKKAYNITLKLIDGNIKNLRYLNDLVIPGIYSTLSWNYGLGRSDEVIKGMKDAIFDFSAEEFGFEPTFDSEESYDWWESLCDDWFEQGWSKDGAGGNLHLKEDKKLKGFLFE
jgi:hypothetical protein